jgi:subtilase family serine protease
MTPGIYYFGILVDGEDDVIESDETNNMRFAKIPVTIK